MTDNEIIKAMKCCGDNQNCAECPLCVTSREPCGDVLASNVIDLINRQKAEIERLEKQGEELQDKLGCLLCHATGSKLSKSTYPLKTMEIAVTDFIEDCCTEAETEAKNEAIKEFAERVKEKTLAMVSSPDLLSSADYIECIDNLAKEMTGEQE